MLRNGNECGENWGNENLKATIPSTDYDRSKTAEECGIFSYLGSMITNDARCTQKIKSWIIMKSSLQQEEVPFHPQTSLTFKEETSKVPHSVWCWNFETLESGSEIPDKS